MSDTKKRRPGRGKKAIVACCSVVLALGFIASVGYSILSGGEIIESLTGDDSDDANAIKGLFRLETNDYETTYYPGDKFSFDKSKNKVMLVAKDPAIEDLVKIDNLPASEYGFTVSKITDETGRQLTNDEMAKEKQAYQAYKQAKANGKTDIEEVKKHTYKVDDVYYQEASDVTMNVGMGELFLSSKEYPNLRTKLEADIVNVDKLDKTSLTLEAENADIYKDGKLLTEAQLETQPSSEKPYLSNKGTPISDDTAQQLSGFACIRNIQKTDKITIQFMFLAKEETTFNLTIKYCLRTAAQKFGASYDTKLNGETIKEAMDHQCPASTATEGDARYFTADSFKVEGLKAKKGKNLITFANVTTAKNNPLNFDGIAVESTQAVLGDKTAIEK